MPARTLESLWTEVPHDKQNGPGCLFGCVYCNQQGLDLDKNGNKQTPYISTKTDAGISVNSCLRIGKEISHRIALDTLVGELTSFPYFGSHTPLLLENFHDPSLNWRNTFNLGEMIFTSGHHGELIFITKGAIGHRSLDQINNLVKKGAKPIFIVTYSGLPQTIEPIPGKTRINTIHKLKEAGLPVILSMRPMIEGINDDRDNLAKVLLEAGSFADAITVGGLYVYDFTHQAFAEAGHSLSDKYRPDLPTESKIIDRELRNKIRDLANIMKIETPIFEHTTCATGYLAGKYYNFKHADRLAHVVRDNRGGLSHCRQFCPQEQLQECQKALAKPDHQAITEAEQTLRKIGYDYSVITDPQRPGVLLIKNGDLHLSETFFLSETTGWHVENLPSYNRLLMKTKAALEAIGLEQASFSLTLTDNSRWQINVLFNSPNGYELDKLVKLLKIQVEAYIRATIDINISFRI